MQPEESAKPKALVSACLLGRECRYDGRHSANPALEEELRERGLEALPFCPEEHGGLSTPRPAAWIEEHSAAAVVDGSARMVTESGRDVTAQFLDGARGALEACRAAGARIAFLKERSPSCGVCQTHVAGKLVDGHGVTAEVLVQGGIDVRGI